jgi:hypothetical protein
MVISMNINRLFYSFTLILLFSFSSCGIDARKDNPNDVYIDQSGIISNGGNIINKGFTFEILKDEVLIKSKVAFEPYRSNITMSYDDYYVVVNNAPYNYNTEEGAIFSKLEYNIKENNYNIFETEISSNITYTFCFIVPKLNDNIEFDEKSVYCYAFHHNVRIINSY